MSRVLCNKGVYCLCYERTLVAVTDKQLEAASYSLVYPTRSATHSNYLFVPIGRVLPQQWYKRLN